MCNDFIIYSEFAVFVLGERKPVDTRITFSIITTTEWKPFAGIIRANGINLIWISELYLLFAVKLFVSEPDKIEKETKQI